MHIKGGYVSVINYRRGVSMKHYIGKFIKIFLITLCLFAIAVGVAVGGAIFGYWGNVDEIDVDSLTLNQNSTIVASENKFGGKPRVGEYTKYSREPSKSGYFNRGREVYGTQGL